MADVVIMHKETGKVVAQVRVHLAGQNYTPNEAQYHAKAWRIAIDDRLIEADADKDDFTFEIVPVSTLNAFSRHR